MFYVFICTLFFQVDHILGSMELMMTLIVLLLTFFYLFIYCELGEMVSKQFDLFNEKLDQCNWYAFPMKTQKILIIFITNAQQPTLFRGFGNILCTRDTFKKVSLTFDESHGCLKILCQFNIVSFLFFSIRL